jgi:heme-degrading monooxygenase HmoA
MPEPSGEARHLAQINVSRMRYDLDAPEMAAFTERLAFLNGLADRSPGFVWRLADDNGAATSFRPFDDPRIIINVSMWESMERFLAFVHKTAHARMLARRGEWFLPMAEPSLAMWWRPVGAPPTLDDAVARLHRLRAQGPSPEAFSFAHPFDSRGRRPLGETAGAAP